MKSILWTTALIMAFATVSCDSSSDEQKDATTKAPKQSMTDLSEETFVAEMGKLFNGEVTFEALSITYDTWVYAMDEATKKQFFEEDGSVFETLLPKWKAASESLLRELCAFNDNTTEITDYRLNPGRQTGNVTSFEGRVTTKCGSQTKKVRISAIKIDGRMYLLLLKAMPSEVHTY